MSLTSVFEPGPTLAEPMERLGNSTSAAAMRYQHAAQGRDLQIAALLSKLAGDPRASRPNETEGLRATS